METLPKTLRLFPLSEVVLFPGVLLPLHIFESRYRKMVSHALADDRLVGMVLIRSASDDARNPEIYPTGCAGRIVRHEPLEDGRSLIVLRGTLRFRVRRELALDEPYRVAEAQPLHEAPVPAEHMREWRSDLRKRVEAYLRALSAEDETLDKVFEKRDLESIVNYLCAALPLEILERQSLLECSTAEQRTHRLRELVEFKTAEARLGLDASRQADS